MHRPGLCNKRGATTNRKWLVLRPPSSSLIRPYVPPLPGSPVRLLVREFDSAAALGRQTLRTQLCTHTLPTTTGHQHLHTAQPPHPMPTSLFPSPFLKKFGRPRPMEHPQARVSAQDVQRGISSRGLCQEILPTQAYGTSTGPSPGAKGERATRGFPKIGCRGQT